MTPEQQTACDEAFEKSGFQKYKDTYSKGFEDGAAWSAAQAQLMKLVAENRDALQAALPYMGGSEFSAEYARELVRRQVRACQAALDVAPPEQPTSKQGGGE